jgi:hypothetical protein
MRPEFVAPLVSYLCSSACETTRGVYGAGAGWYGRAFAGLAAGWAAPGDVPPTAESLRDRLPEVEARDCYSVPTCVDDETDAVAEQLARVGVLRASADG